MNLSTIVGSLLAFLPLSHGFLTSPSHLYKAPISQYQVNSVHKTGLASSIGIVDTVVDPDHDATRGKTFRTPIESEAAHGAPMIVDILGDDSPIQIDQIGELYDPEFTRFSRINAMIGEYKSLSWNDTKWYLKRSHDKKFMSAYAIYSHASHGTHVAGVALQDNSEAKYLSIRFINEFPFSINPSQKAQLNQTDNKKLLPKVIETIVVKSLKKMILGLRQRYMRLASVANQFKIDVLNLSLGIPPGTDVINGILSSNNLYLSEDKIASLARLYDNAIGQVVRMSLMQCPNTIFVFAAGNESINVEKIPYLYHVSKHPRGIVVGAVDAQQQLAHFSNHGKEVVNIAAQGVNIPSSVPGNSLLYMSGTSMATPAVTRVVARLVDLGLPLNMIKKVLMDTSVQHKHLDNHVESGVLNEEAALKKALEIIS